MPNRTKRRKPSRSTKKVDSTPKEKKSSGRPTDYDQVRCCRVARAVLEIGGTETDLAIALGVSRSTVFEWKGKYPEFVFAIVQAKAVVDAQVVSRLLDKALGRESITEQKLVKTKDGYKKFTLKRQVPADSGSVEMWLYNRRPEDFKKKQTIENTGVAPVQVLLYEPASAVATGTLQQSLEALAKVQKEKATQ